MDQLPEDAMSAAQTFGDDNKSMAIANVKRDARTPASKMSVSSAWYSKTSYGGKRASFKKKLIKNLKIHAKMYEIVPKLCFFLLKFRPNFKFF